MATARSHGGNYQKRTRDIQQIQLSDFTNPWNFYGLFLGLNQIETVKWCQQKGLLRETCVCQFCDAPCTLTRRKRKKDGVTFRCSNNNNHEYSVRGNSFFSGSHYDLQVNIPFLCTSKCQSGIPEESFYFVRRHFPSGESIMFSHRQDVMQFIYSFLTKDTLWQTSKDSGFDYKKSSVDWANFIRDLFREYVYNTYENLVFHGDVEVDESLFGRRVKAHRGNPRRGVKVR